MEFVLLKMIVKNFDNKQSFLFSEVSRASQEEKAKKMLTRRAERWEWGAHTKGSLPFMLSNLRLPRAPIYSFFRFFFFFFYSRNRFRKKKGTAPKLGRILWFINCFFSLQSTRAASLPTADGLSFSSKRKAGSSRHFKWEVHMHIYTRFFFFFFFLTLNRSTFNKVSMYPGLFWFWNIVLIVLWTICASLTSDYDQSFFFVEVRRAYRKSQRKKVRLMLVRYAQLWERGTRFFTPFSEFYTARFSCLARRASSKKRDCS